MWGGFTLGSDATSRCVSANAPILIADLSCAYCVAARRHIVISTACIHVLQVKSTPLSHYYFLFIARKRRKKYKRKKRASFDCH